MGFFKLRIFKISIAVIVVVVISLGYWLISPLWTKVYIAEEMPSFATTSVMKTGSFSGFDRIHTGSGTVTVLEVEGKKYIRFEKDFVVNNGPDLYVGLGKDGSYIKGSEIAKLKGTVGSQNYELPSGITIEDIDEVWIWCKAFSTPFAKAQLSQ